MQLRSLTSSLLRCVGEETDARDVPSAGRFSGSVGVGDLACGGWGGAAAMPGGTPLYHPLVGCFHWNLLGWTLGGCWTGATGKFSGAGGGAFPGDVAGSETGSIHVIANWSFFFLPPFCFFSGMAVAMPRIKAGRTHARARASFGARLSSHKKNASLFESGAHILNLNLP